MPQNLEILLGSLKVKYSLPKYTCEYEQRDLSLFFPTYARENEVKHKSGSHRLDELVAYHLLVTPAEKYKQKLLSATLHILITLLFIHSLLKPCVLLVYHNCRQKNQKTSSV